MLIENCDHLLVNVFPSCLYFPMLSMLNIAVPSTVNKHMMKYWDAYHFIILQKSNIVHVLPVFITPTNCIAELD